ncbi:MAG: DUF192 domain-containing protein [Chloroflexota bacterium]|nr:MAG: DUF192 domain-containing protein [Chloroflexota bacterium]
MTPAITASASPTGAAPETVLAADWARLEEIWRVVETLGPNVWDGWGEERPPFLLQVGDADYLIGHPSPPEGFDPVAGFEVVGVPLLRRAGHLAPGIGVQLLGDHLGVALLPRVELQAFLDGMLGVGMVTLDDVQYVRWAAHEAFHVHQLEQMAMDLPRFGFEGDEMELAVELGHLGGFTSQLADEARLLRAALATSDDAELREAVSAFLAARESRRANGPGDVAGFEQAVEWSEGLARYTDVQLLEAAGSDYQPSAAFIALGAEYAEPEQTWQAALAWLDDLSSVPGTVRDRYYELGAAQAYLLDRLMPGWQPRAFPGGESLEGLLAAALGAGAQGVPVALRSLGLADLRLGDETYLVAVADAPDEWARGLAGVDDLGTIDGLLFAFPEPVEAAFFMRGATIPLDVAFLGPDGRCMKVQTMTLCAADPCPTYRAPAPYRWALETPAGELTGIADGALMELEPRRR